MPIVIPVTGSSDDSTIERLYSARSSIRINAENVDSGLESIDAIRSIQLRAAYQEVAPSNKVFNRKAASSIRVIAEDLFGYETMVEISTGDSFTILADLLQAVFATVGDGSTDMGCRLLVNGSEVAIKSFSFEVPTGRLGSILNVVLAEPDKTIVPTGASVEFDLLVNGHSYPLMVNGKLQERDMQLTFKGGPTDSLTFGALDVISDKFSLAPRQPVVMFDPSRVKYDEVAVKPRDAIQNENGSPILPVIEPVFGLTMRQIINRAYASGTGSLFISTVGSGFLSGVSWGHLIGGSGSNPNQNGCGFVTVITNIPDYRVRRADFTIEGGWHDGAQPSVAMYGPVYFVENNKLFIIDVDRILPFGVAPHVINLSDHKILDERVAFKPDANAVLLTYQYSPNDPSEDILKQKREVFTETVDEDTVNGVYRKIVTRRWDYEWFFPDDPTTVLASLPENISIETYQDVQWWIQDGGPLEVDFTQVGQGVQEVHKEETHYIYEGELLVHMTKTTSAAISAGPGLEGGNLIDVLEEITDISWTDDPFHPGVKLQDRVITDVQGRIVYGEDHETIVSHGETIDNVLRRYPILVAQASGVLNANTVMSSVMEPIKTIRETLHHISDKQYNVSVVEVDYLNNTVRNSTSNPVTGSNDTSQFGSKSRSVLFRDLVSEADIGPRIPVPVNAYELPRALAFKLARNALKRIKNPLQQMPISLPDVDLVIRRGSIIKGQLRDGTYSTNFFVTGYTIVGQNLGRQGHRISQSLEAIELLTTP